VLELDHVQKFSGLLENSHVMKLPVLRANPERTPLQLPL
jgi:hypothetical protein